jgi:ABC-type proline/glycine betaine transport system permease subunit
LFFLVFAFSKNTRIEKTVRIILITQFFLTVLTFLFYSVKFGIERSYLFEVATITISWLVIIVIGIMIGINFKRKLKAGSINQLKLTV